MTRTRGITVYGTAMIVFGVYNLIGLGNYGQFSMMFRPLPHLFVLVIYLFTVLYGICGVYCGMKILRLEDWARKVMVVMTSISVLSGLLLNRMVMRNFREFIDSSQSNVPPELADPIYIYAVILTALVTIFEMSVVYYFTRPKVRDRFSLA